MKKNSCLASVVSLLVTISAHATVYDLKLLFDTDRSRATGCTVTLSSFSFAGVEQVIDTRVDVVGSVAVTLGVTRRACAGGLLGSATPVDTHGWPAGITPAGDLFIETHVPLAALGMTTLTPMRIGLMVTDGALSDAVLATPSGSDLLFPEPGRRRAVVTTPSALAITLDGLDPEWIHVPPVAGGGEGAPDLRFINGFAVNDASEVFFAVRLQANHNAPTAVGDIYTLATAGGALNVPAGSGVLANDVDPNGSPLTAALMTGVQHGILTLSGNGAFTYTHDGSPAPLDTFEYRVGNGTLTSNTAQVRIGIGATNTPAPLPAPAFTSADHAAFVAYTAGTFTVTTSPAHPTPHISASGFLPGGITFHDNGDGTGSISGATAPHAGGVYHLMLTATNLAGTATQNFTLTINQNPDVVSVDSTNFTIGTASTFIVSSTGFPTPSLSESGALPSGVTFADIGNGSATLQGTPAPGTGGIYTLLITAANSIGSSSQTFTLRVSQGPSFTSPNTVLLQAGTAANFTVTTSGFPPPGITQIGALPAGVTFIDNGNGTATIGGTPANGSGGTYPINLTATNSAGTASQTLTIMVCNSLVVNNPATTNGTAGTAFSQPFTQTGAVGALTFALSSGVLPAGLSLAADGTLSGTPSQAGTFPITVSVVDGNGCTGTGATYNLAIACQTITVSNSPAAGTATYNVAYGPVTFSATPAAAYTWSATGLPPGLSINATSGALSGTPTDTGSYSVTVTATAANVCTGTSSFTLVSQPQANGDLYSIVVNTQAVITGTGQPLPLAFKNLGTNTILANDAAPAAHPLSATAATAATVAGGLISIDVAGGFTYTPPVAFTGIDSYVYSATSNGVTVNATLTFTVGNRIWYVKNDAAPGGDGRSNTPFNSLAALVSAAVAIPGDIIYLFAGNGTTIGYDTGITLLNGQTLAGEGVALIVAGSPLRAAGVKPIVSNTSGNAITLADSNLITGLQFAASANAAIAGNGAGGTTTIDRVDVGNAGAPLTGSASGVSLVNQVGSLTISNSQLRVDSTGKALSIVGGNGTVNVNSTATTENIGTALFINARTGGSVTFDATSSINATGTSGAVVISGNAGAASVTFGGTLTLNTTGATGFFADGGTVQATNANNTVQSSGAPAVDLQNVTIGASGISFKSIDANGGLNGIVLVNTGTGPFTVTGTGTIAGSGGTVANAQERGAKLSNASNVTLRNMAFNDDGILNLDPAAICGAAAAGTNINCAAAIDLQNVTNISLNNVAVTGGVQIGINGNTVAGLTLDTVTVTESGDQNREGGVQLVNVTGTASVTSSTFSNNHRRQFELQNALGSLNLTIAGSTFHGGVYGTNGSQGLTVVGRGTASITASIKSSQFTNNFVHGILGKSAETANVNLTIGSTTVPAEGNTFTDNSMAIHIATHDASTMTYLVGRNNATVSPVVFAGSTAMTFRRDNDASGLVTGTITGNAIGNGTPGSGSQCSCSGGITVNDSGMSAGGSRITITDNTVRNVSGVGIEVIGSGNGTEFVTITGNTISDPDSGFSEAIYAVSSNSNGLCLDIQNNIIGGTWFTPVPANIILQQFNGAGFRVVNLVGSTPADLVAYLNSANTNAQAFATATTSFAGGAGACSTNTAPVVNPMTFSIDENSANGTSVGTVTYTTADSGEAYTFSITGGNLSNAFQIDPATGEITVRTKSALDFEFTPLFTLTVQVTDNGAPAASGSAAVTINVNDVNERPDAADDGPYSVGHGATLIVGAASGVLTNDSDVDAATTLTAVLADLPSYGSLTLNADGSFTYVHDGSNTLTDTFTYRASDGSLTSAKATVTIDIGADQPPVAVADSYNVKEGDTISPNAANGVLGNDTDSDTPHNNLTAVLVTPPAHGLLTMNANGKGGFTYVHDGTDTGNDSFTYHASDGILTSADVTVTLNVNPVNDVPIAMNETVNAAVGVGVTTNFPAPGVLANDTDEELDGLHVSSVTFGATTLPVNNATSPVTIATAHGSVRIFRTGRFVYTSDGTGAGGTDSFSYTASDRGSDTPSSNAATVTINLTP